MINRLEISWKLDGFVDEQRYYCSETAFTAETKPEPKVVLAGDLRTYTDTDIESGKTYYVAVGSVKNSTEKLSEVKLVRTVGDEYWTNVISLLHFDNSTDDEAGRLWSKVGSIEFIDNPEFFGKAAHFDSTSNYIHTDAAEFFDFNDSFTVEFSAKIIARPLASGLGSIINIGIPNTITLYSGFGVDSSGLPYFYEYNNNTGTRLFGSSPLPLNEKKHFALCYNKTTNILYIFIDGILIASRTMPAITRPTDQRFTIGSGYTNYMTNCILDEFRYTKGIARYIENFTPPDAPFPNY